MDYSIFVKLLQMYCYIFVGFLIGLALKERKDKVRTIGAQILIKLIAPFQIFIVLTTTTFTLSFSFIIQIILVSLGLYVFTTLTTQYFLKKKEIEPKKMGTFQLLNAYPNVMFFTMPIILSIFSEELIIVSVIVASTLNVLRGSITTYLCEKYGSDNKMNLKETFIKLITFPPFIGILAGSLVLALQIPMPTTELLLIKSPINTLASATGSILIGIILSSIVKQEVKKYWSDIRIVAFWRFVMSFSFFIAIVYLLKFEIEFQTEIRTILLIIVMGPPAVYSVIFSIYFKLDEKFAAISIATVTLMSLVLLPVLIYFGQWAF
jgi:predicted permease